MKATGFLLMAMALLPLRAGAQATGGDSDTVLRALVTEAHRASEELRSKPGAPLYYLSYRVRDLRAVRISASFGALVGGVQEEGPLEGRSRLLDVSVRVGTPELDNTHQLLDGGYDDAFVRSGFGLLPVADDEGALRLGLWRATDEAYKNAAQRLIRVKTNKAVKVAVADDAADFSAAKAEVDVEPLPEVKLDRALWRERLQRVSAVFKDHPYVLHSSATLDASLGSRYFVDSDGARLREPDTALRVMLSATVKADDGMELELYRDFEATTPEALPSEETLRTAANELATRLEALRTAPVIDPYSGPAIVTNRAAAVFFHEIFGHRIEGHRQKDADEGHTFTHKVGQQIVPPFISVVDDPTRAKFGDTPLNGYYRHDDEGVAAEKVSLVENGVLKGFLLGRSPIHGFSRSNGHGRAAPGESPVARQGNLIVSSTKRVPFAELKRELIAEVKRQGKPYGLIFDEISGGFTHTRAGMEPQAFKVLPLVVERVYPDGRPDELVRGVDLIGTPLESFEKILATGDDDAVFNGYCGAESGFVPVSAVSPSLLLGEVEVERRQPDHDRPPLLPPPLHPDAKWPTPQAPAQGVAR